jgi:hypothetical protein
MGVDEEGTHERLKAHFAQLVEPKIKEHRGRTALAFGAGHQDRELHSLHARRFLHGSDLELGIRLVWVHEQGDHAGMGHQLRQQLEPLGLRRGTCW